MAETFEGRPCRRCGGTTRYLSSRHCVACRAERYQDPAFLEQNRESARRRYESLSGPEYNRLLLGHRRTKALRRMAERNRRREVERGALPT